MSQDFQKGVCAHPNCLFGKDPVEDPEQVKDTLLGDTFLIFSIAILK